MSVTGLPKPITPVLNNTGVANPNNAYGKGSVQVLFPVAGGTMAAVNSPSSNPYVPVAGTPGLNGPTTSSSGIVFNKSNIKTPLATGGPGTLLNNNPTTGIYNPIISSPTGYVPTGTDPVPQQNGDPGGVSQQENKQLVDIYGKGTGNLLSSEIANLGSNDSTYMQAYAKAMAGQNAENLATLNTTLSNEGVSGNSSTAAIANADFQSQITAQEGLQEQQLQMNDLQNLLQLTESTMGASQKEVSSGGFLNDLGHVLGAVGGVAGDIFSGGLSDIFGGATEGAVEGISSVDFSGIA